MPLPKDNFDLNLEFKKFNESVLDKLYDMDEFNDIFILTNSEEIVKVQLHWRQGWGNNYHFSSGNREYLPSDVYMYSVVLKPF